MNRQKGFTLVELLVVITIIGILIAIAVPSVARIRERAKETQVQFGINDIVRALELFAQANGGNYPGVALPRADDDGIETFWDGSGVIDLFGMRGVVGGGFVPHDPTLISYFDGFYFPPEASPPGPPGREQVPDRLYASGSIERYPTNPFRKNVRNLTNQGIPMVNIWGIEIERDIVDDPIDYLEYHLSYPFMYDPALPGDYNYPSPSDFSGPVDFDYFYMGDYRGVLWDPDGNFHVNEGELQKYFPEGDFAYIPLDPVQRDPQNSQYMRFCQNYWIIGYGSKRTAMRNKYESVVPNFPRPLGDGQYDPLDPLNPLTFNPFERAVKNALVGAAFVVGTRYTEQFNIAGND